MSYEIVWEGDSFDELNSLPKEVSVRILEKLEQASDFPEHYTIRLKGLLESKLRVGDYRAILIVNSINKTLQIQAVGHRKNIYKKYKTD